MESLKKIYTIGKEVAYISAALYFILLFQEPQTVFMSTIKFLSQWNYFIPQFFAYYLFFKNWEKIKDRILERKAEIEHGDTFFGIPKIDFAKFYVLDKNNRDTIVNRFKVSREIAEKIISNLENKGALTRGSSNRLLKTKDRINDILPLLNELDFQILRDGQTA
ncbi:MAG: hypothetical protein WCJ84_00350 [Candidatus Peregrinibacteria bacterium]